MIYKFRCQATGDLIMLGPHGDHFLALLGRDPAPKGILEVAHMPQALRRLEAAVQADEAARGRPRGDDEGEDDERPGADPIPLRQRLWPMVEMIRQAQAADRPIVWGV
ncbi:MAG: DUF1840 domain-containing protein [Burkholderiales bacterium]|nr:DUF1840 domain-containing protein [Burkholderiales bacterium]